MERTWLSLGLIAITGFIVGTYIGLMIHWEDVVAGMALVRSYAGKYYQVNYVIFIVLFLLLTGGNLLAAEIVRMKEVKPRNGKGGGWKSRHVEWKKS